MAVVHREGSGAGRGFGFGSGLVARPAYPDGIDERSAGLCGLSRLKIQGPKKLKNPAMYMLRQIGRQTTDQKFPPVMVRAWRKEVSIIGPRTMARIRGAAENATLRKA
mgnify:CR=1 FL=1